MLGGQAISTAVPAADSAIILQYHHFSTDTPPSTSVAPALFAKHLDFLAENGFVVWPLARIIDHFEQGKPLPDRCVAITVDDAYASVYSEAFPLLRRRGWPMTVFVSTEAVDRGYRNFMTWAQMREMAAAGVAFENHSHTHAHLVRRLPGETEAAWHARVIADIDSAQKRIRDELGQTSHFFAYPYGEYDKDLEALVREHGFVGFGQQSGPAWAHGDLGALPRFPMAASYAAMPVLKDKVLSLPLPVLSAQPDDPILPLNEWRPLLTLRLASGGYRPQGLRCYVTGQGQAAVAWKDAAAGIVEVRATKPLPVGRSRYNCTAPAVSSGRYYWYSQPWIRRNKDGSWYREE